MVLASSNVESATGKGAYEAQAKRRLLAVHRVARVVVPAQSATALGSAMWVIMGGTFANQVNHLAQNRVSSTIPTE